MNDSFSPTFIRRLSGFMPFSKVNHSIKRKNMVFYSCPAVFQLLVAAQTSFPLPGALAHKNQFADKGKITHFMLINPNPPTVQPAMTDDSFCTRIQQKQRGVRFSDEVKIAEIDRNDHTWLQVSTLKIAPCWDLCTV